MTIKDLDDARVSVRQAGRDVDAFWALLREKDYTAWKLVVEPHPTEPGVSEWKVQFTNRFPEELSALASNVSHQLRSALDRAAFALAMASNPSGKGKDTHFPYGRTEQQAKDAIKSQSKEIPQQIFDKMLSFKPYFDSSLPPPGNALWGLNQISNADKHRLITRAVRAIGKIDLGSVAVRNAVPFLPPRWDAERDALIIGEGAPDGEIRFWYGVKVTVSFNSVPPFEGQPADAVLKYLHKHVGEIIDALEVEGRVLGFLV